MKISIITVCLNSALTIAKTFDSIEKQTYKNIEVIVIDGGSTDGTTEIVQSYANLINVFVCEPDKGIYDALNKGVSLATGDIIATLHSNDFLASEIVLEKVASEYNKMPDLEVLFTSVNFVSTKQNRVLRNYTGRYFKLWMLNFGWIPPHTGSFIRSSVYRKVGLFDISYKIAGDFDFLLRVLMTYRCVYRICSLVSVSMTTGGASTSGLKSYRCITKECRRSLSENGYFSNKLLISLRGVIKLHQFNFIRVLISHFE